MFHLPKLILASGSPEFEKHVPDIDETEGAGERAEDYVVRLAKEKALAVAAHYSEAIVLGADTTVVIDEQIIAKPNDLEHACEMLRMLSGRWHEVLTGVAIAQDGALRTGLQRTRVKFAAMTEDEVDFLAREGDPLDKAGAYAVQAQAALFIEGIEGDYWNVVGLPVSLVYRLVRLSS
jgi:septum formation protein